MGHYPFTLFNCVTALILALALVVAWARLRRPLDVSWPLVIYALIAIYALAFSGGLNLYWVGAAVIFAVTVRAGLYPRITRWGEWIALAYIVWRCLGLILMW